MSGLLPDQSANLTALRINAVDKAKQPSLIRECVAAFKANIVPGLIIQAVALLVVLSYFFIPPVKQALNTLGVFKSQSEWHAIAYAVISGNIFTVLIPMIFMAFMRRLGPVAWWKQAIFFVLLFTERSLEAHFLYTGLDILVRDLPVPLLVKSIIKMACDQFIYTLFYAAWTIAALYRLKDMNFTFKAWLKSFDRHFWTRVVPVTTVSAWTVWIPGTLLIYMLPLPLQIPLNNLLSCFFVLVLAIISMRGTTPNQQPAQVAA